MAVGSEEIDPVKRSRQSFWRDGRGIQNGEDAQALAERDGVNHGRNRDFKLEHDRRRAGDEFLGGVDVRRRELRVGASATTIEFSPLRSTRIIAHPLATPSVMVTRSVFTPCCTRPLRSRWPKSSSPTRPMKWTLVPGAAKFRGADGLICPLAAGNRGELIPHHGFPRLRNTPRAANQVHIDRSDHDNSLGILHALFRLRFCRTMGNVSLS